MGKDINTVLQQVSMWRKDGNFVRRATVGDWINYFSKEQNDYVNAKSKEYLEQLGVTFDYTV